jgi:integrase/recombinase XerD
MPLGVKIEKDHWDNENEKILPAAKLEPSTGWYNDRILEKKMAANKLLISLDGSGELQLLTLNDLVKRIENKASKASLYDYLDEQIKFLRDHKKEGSAVIYEGAKRFLLKYAPENKHLRFEDITYKFLKNIEFKYIANGNSHNGLSNYLRTIRAVWNKAEKDGLVSNERYPFKEYKIKHSKTHKTAIKRDEMKKLRELPVRENTVSWHGRNAFFFSFYCRGMNLSDIAKLQLKNIQNDKIIYKRSKNSKQFIVKVIDLISGVLDIYTPGKQSDDYIFPIIDKHNHKETAEKQITKFRNIINHSLRRWAKRLDIDPSLSFNTARHSWATIGKDKGVNIAAISEGMGHADIRTTQIYLDDFQGDEIDAVNLQITDL